MKPEFESRRLLSNTQAKAKMYEFDVPVEEHVDVLASPTRLFPLAIGNLGEIAARINDENIIEDELRDLQDSLPFSAHFFDAFAETKLNEEYSQYLWLMGAASYYLCDLPGSANILAKRLKNNELDLDGLGLENILTWLLLIKEFPTEFPDLPLSPYRHLIALINQLFLKFYETGSDAEVLLGEVKNLRKFVYRVGTPRQLLLSDLIGAVIQKRLKNSTWSCLPDYTDISADEWAVAIKKDTFVKEFWPAQHLLGKNDVFRGKSAVVQMPTSAGKTKATEIIIRSAFLSKRTSLAVIIAPFRALCHEIRQSFLEAFRDESVYVDELSDVLQEDYSIERILGDANVLIATPEKFNYVLRHEPTLAQKIGLIIYDEGHQFDSGTRGITYELLLTSLKTRILKTTQTILISAVISNANNIGKWLAGDTVFSIVDGSQLTPSTKSTGFATTSNRGRNLWFVQGRNIDTVEYFVPRIFEEHKLKHRVVFPRLNPEQKERGKDIALFLGLRLAGQGSIAIFSGTKDTVGSMCETIIKAYRNGLEIPKPSERLKSVIELQKLQYLHDINLGPNSIFSQAANLGIFTHHNNMPHGIRLAIEYAMKEADINFVICTSTLAQGVNLPIRYLIVTSVYQGKEKISVRDFQNLIGRSGRSGMHTEGSILFAAPIIYDERKHWQRVKELLDPSKSEECDSQLLAFFRPIYNDYKNVSFEIDIAIFIEIYLSGRDAINSLISELIIQCPDDGFSEYSIRKQIAEKVNTLSATESYLMAYWDPLLDVTNETAIIDLGKGTLAYSLASADEQEKIERLFLTLAGNLEAKMPDPIKRKIFGKTMYGIPDSLAISDWVDGHFGDMNSEKTDIELLEILWPLIENNIHNRSFAKCSKPDSLKILAFSWLEGNPFHKLFNQFVQNGAQIIAGSQLRDYRVDHIVDICENGLAYEGILVLGALIELLPSLPIKNIELLTITMQHLQKRLKYGLPNSHAIILYEIGFADRVVAIDLSQILQEVSIEKSAIGSALKAKEEDVFSILDKYPAYFRQAYANLK